MTLGFLALGMVLLTAVIPTYRCLKYLDLARANLNIPLQGFHADHPAWQMLQSAAAADTWDPTPHRAQAEWLVWLADTREGEEKLVLLRATIGGFVGIWVRDTCNVHLWRLIGNVARDIARLTNNVDDYADAASYFIKVLDYYPQNPSDWVRLAEIQREGGEATSTEWLFKEAMSNYERALDLDDQRLPWEEFHQFTEVEKEAIKEKIKKAKASIEP